MSPDLTDPLWLGPQTYQEKDASRFHGRDAETAELLDLIRREPLVLLHGESGHGKSSLLQAGLAPRLREQGALPIILRDLFRKDVPDITTALLTAITAQAASHEATAPEPCPGDTLWEYFHRANSWFTGPDGQSLVPVLILDQFEDLFRRCDWRPGDSGTPAAHFLAQLADLLENREPATVRERRLRREGDAFDHTPTALRVLIGLREDALPDLTPLRATIPGLARTHYRLRPLARASATEVILRPVAGSPAHARLLGENPALLAEDILTRMAAAPAAGDSSHTVDPFLLSVVMDQLQRRAAATPPAVITHDLVKDGVAAALDTFYETAVALVPVPLRDWLETSAGLVTAGGFRNSVAADDAEHALRDPATSAHLRTLENAHLLRAEPRPDGSLRFELVHDRLCPVLAGKIRLRAEARAEQERLCLEAQAEEECRRAAALDRARKRALIVAALAVAACLVAVLFYFQARAAREDAVKQAGIAETAKADAQKQTSFAKTAAAEAETARIAAVKSEKEADAERDKAKAQVKEASRSDTATAQARLAEGKWQEAVAYLGRAIRYDAENRNAQDALWLALRYGQRDAGRLPEHILKHEDPVRSATFSPDGTCVVTASWDKTARVWDARTGQSIGPPLKHEGSVNSAAFSPDGTRVITASSDKTARVWDATTSQPIGSPLKHEKSVTSAAFSPDGTRVITASSDKTARVWDASTGQPIGSPLKHEDTVDNAAFSPDSTRVVTASDDNTARVWDATTSQPIGSPLKHADRVNSAAFSPDGTRVVTASWDRIACVWDATTGQPIGSPLKHERNVTSATFSPDGTHVVTASWDKTARVWDARTGQPIGSPLKHERAINSAAFSPDGTRVVTAGEDTTAHVWDAKTGQPIGSPLKYADRVNGAAFSPDGTRVVTASWDKTACVWDVTTGRPIGSPLKHDNTVTSAAFSPDATHVVTASWHKTVRVWDAGTGQPIGSPLKHERAVNSAAFSPDGTRVVTASENSTACVWDATTGQPIGSLLKHENYVKSAAFSPDGTRVVTASSGNAARVWDVTTGQPIGPPLIHERAVNSAAFSPDGTRVVTASENSTARVWNATTGQPIGSPLKHERAVNSASFSKDGTHVVTASDDHTARVWDATTGQPIGSPLKHDSYVNSAAFSPDGTRVVTASEDNTVRVWHARTGQPIGSPLKHESKVTSAAFSQHGALVVTASWDKTARVWDATTGQPLTTDAAEWLTGYRSGARLDPELGSLQLLTKDERMVLREKLTPFLSASTDWAFVADQNLSQDPKTALISPRMTLTLREATTRLISTMEPGSILEAAAVDPGHPLLPFAHAALESRQIENQPANPIRAAWLVGYGMKSLPADTTPADLRLAAKLVAKVAESLPEHAKTALALLDRAKATEPEDEETQELRKELEKPPGAK